MFRRLSEPLPLSEASVLLFRPALNAPVLNVGYLPIGPARAAVVAFGEEYGGIGIALGVRASESGQLVVLRNQESIDFDVPLAQALEPLLAQAERMGFLFDEDMLEETPGQAGRARAMAHWADLMGGMESLLPLRSPDPDLSRNEDGEGPAGPLSPSRAVAELQYLELMLDDVAPLELADEPEAPTGFDPTDILDDSLDGGLGDDLDDVLDGDDDWTLEDSVLGESDRTEPTAPIAAASAKAATAPVSAPLPLARAAPAPASVSAPLPAPAVAPAPVVAKPAVVVPPPVPRAQASAEPALPPARPPRVVLSKFRNPEGLRDSAQAGGSSEVGADRSSELARIPIVRVRRERDPAKRVPLLARLLSSF